MPRELYPYAPERAVIRNFLGGNTHDMDRSEDTSLRVVKSVLLNSDARYLWYDSADAVTTVVDGPITKHIANYVLEQVGATERVTVEVRDEVRDDKAEGSHHRVRYYFGGVPADEAPFVLVGPMTLMAWRAANGFKLRRK